MPTRLAPRLAVTVEKLDAGPAPGRAELQLTRENILAGILQTPTVWMDFDSAIDRDELDFGTPVSHPSARGSGAVPFTPGVATEDSFAQRPDLQRTGVQVVATRRITPRSTRRD